MNTEKARRCWEEVNAFLLQQQEAIREKDEEVSTLKQQLARLSSQLEILRENPEPIESPSSTDSAIGDVVSEEHEHGSEHQQPRSSSWSSPFFASFARTPMRDTAIHVPPKKVESATRRISFSVKIAGKGRKKRTTSMSPQKHGKIILSGMHGTIWYFCRCNVAFKQLDSLVNHIAAKERQWECSVCHKRHSYYLTLKRHLEKCHGITKNELYGCQKCGHLFEYRHLLKEHCQLFHSETKLAGSTTTTDDGTRSLKQETNHKRRFCLP